MPIGNFLKRLFTGSPGSPGSPGSQEQIHPDEEAIHDEALKLLPLGARRTVRYPPFIEGFPAYLSSDYLLGLQDELYTKLLGGVGLPKSEFDEIVRPAILNYARFVHLLPASENHHHCGPGGLLRHGLEVAYFSMNGTKNTAFDSRRPPSERSRRAVRWNVAGLLCGLLHDTGKAVTDMQIVYPPSDLKWVHSEHTVEEWAKKHGLRKYYIEWNKGRHMRHVIKSRDLVMTLCPPQTLTWLMAAGDDILDALMDAIVGKEESPLYRVLMMADGKSTKLDMASGEAPQYMTGVPVIKLLTSAMTRLIKEGDWSINVPGARVWTTTQGVFIAWNSGAQEIIDLILNDKVEAIPRSPTSLLMRLVDQSIAEPGPDGEMYWEVAPHCLQKSDKPMILRCMKLASADTLFPYDPVPAPISVRIRQGGELIEYSADTEAQASIAIHPESQEKEQPQDALSPSITEHQDNAPTQAKPKTKKTVPAAAPATATELPVLSEPSEVEPASKRPKPEAQPDVVLAQLAEIEVHDNDEASRQGFLDSALLCLSGQDTVAYDEAEAETAVAIEPEAAPAQKPSKPQGNVRQVTMGTIMKVDPKSSSIQQQPAKKEPQKEKLRLNGARGEQGGGRGSSQGKTQPNQQEGRADRVQSEPPVLVQTAPEKTAPIVLEAQGTNYPGLKLTSEEKSALDSNPDLAQQLLATLDRPDIFNSYLRRVFVPLRSAHPEGLEDAVADQLIACDWVWHDFTDESSAPIYTASRLTGIVLPNWLGTIVTRNLKRELQVFTAASVGDERTEQLIPLSIQLVAQASSEKLRSGVSVLSLTQHKLKQISACYDANPEDGLCALHLHRDTVYNWRRKIAYILPVEGELKRLNQHG